uniref:WD repeat-containing protein WRAP73 n=1 Tax=Schistocephalus solidus TaxID=70667 RepID=A0A0X3NI66_SCHSO
MDACVLRCGTKALLYYFYYYYYLYYYYCYYCYYCCCYCDDYYYSRAKQTRSLDQRQKPGRRNITAKRAQHSVQHLSSSFPVSANSFTPPNFLRALNVRQSGSLMTR